MTYLESAYKHQAIVFRRFSAADGITVRKILDNLGLRNIKLISSDLDTNIFEILNLENPEARAIFVQYINPENQKPYTVSLYFQPIEKTDGTLYIRVTYTKPGDVPDDRKTVYSKSEPMVVSFMIVYDFQAADGKINALAQLSASIDQKLEKGEEQLTKEDFEFIHGCYELDRIEQYMNDGQFYHARNRFNDALLMFRRVSLMLKPEIAQGDEKDRLQYALVCMYIAKSYEQKGILSKAMYYINLAKSMDYIYETDAGLMRAQYDKDTDIATEINIGYILNRVIDADINSLDPVLAKTRIEHGKTTIVRYQRPENDKDKSLISNNSAIIINSNKVTDTEGAEIIRIDITAPHFAHDNDKFDDEKYNIPDNATLVLSADYNPTPDLKAGNMDKIIAEAGELTKQKYYIEALIRLEFAVQKLKNTYTRDPNRRANYIKALQLISECSNRLALNEKAIFYASELKTIDAQSCGPLYIHCLIDADDPRALSEVNKSVEKTAKMQLFLKRKEE